MTKEATEWATRANELQSDLKDASAEELQEYTEAFTKIVKKLSEAVYTQN